MITVAEIAAHWKEFQIALWPAANAPGNSVQVRFTQTSWNSGNPIANTQSKIVQTPQNQNQPRPSCRRKSLGDTRASIRGHGISRRENQKSRSSGASHRGKVKR